MSQARILTDREFRKVLLYIASHKHASRNKCLLYMSHLAGLRAKEISDLSIKDVLAEDGSIKDQIYLRPAQTKGVGDAQFYCQKSFVLNCRITYVPDSDSR